MICGHCNKEFEYHRKRKYCSKECCLEANKKEVKGIKTGICAYEPCSKPFTGRANKRFCSSNCCTHYSHGNTVVPGIMEIAKIANAPKTNIHVLTCAYSGRLFVSKYYRKHHPDYTQHQINHVPAPKIKHTCIDCEQPFLSTIRNKSGLCTTCRLKEERRIARSRRRARIRGTVRENVSPLRVFLRDNWTCQLCGIWTPRELRGTMHPCAPETDHIIPLCKGGVHSYANVHCSCRQCNGIKGDKLTFNMIKKYERST